MLEPTFQGWPQASPLAAAGGEELTLLPAADLMVVRLTHVTMLGLTTKFGDNFSEKVMKKRSVVSMLERKIRVVLE